MRLTLRNKCREKLPLILVGSSSLLNDADHVRRRHRWHSSYHTHTHTYTPMITDRTSCRSTSLNIPEGIHLRCRSSAIGRNSLFDGLANPNSPRYSAVNARVLARPGRVKTLGVQAGWRPSRLPIWESKRAIRGPVLRPRAPICVLVRLPGPPGAAGEERRGGGGGETTRSCTHGGEHHLTEAPDECRAPHRSSVLPVHMYARGVFLHSPM